MFHSLFFSYLGIDHNHMKDASTLPTVLPTATKAHQQIHYILTGPLDTNQQLLFHTGLITISTAAKRSQDLAPWQQWLLGSRDC